MQKRELNDNVLDYVCSKDTTTFWKAWRKRCLNKQIWNTDAGWLGATCRNRSRGSPWWSILYQKVEFWGPHSHTSAPNEVKFCTAKWTHVPLGPAKFHVNRCNESPYRMKNLIFGLWVNLIPAVCASRNPAG